MFKCSKYFQKDGVKKYFLKNSIDGIEKINRITIENKYLRTRMKLTTL